MKKIFILLTFINLFFLYACAPKTQVDTMEERLAKLETDLNYQIEEFGAKKQATERSFREKSAETRAGIDKLQSEIQKLTGKVEELEYKLSQFSTIADQNQKLLAGYSQPPSPGGDAVQSTSGQQSEPVSESPGQSQEQKSVSGASRSSSDDTQTEAPADEAVQKEDLYDSSKKLFDSSKFKEARAGFQKFLKTNPKSSKASSAQFWIAETYYRENSFDQAALEYENLIKKYPKSPKAATAYLKQAYAFDRAGEKAVAKDILKDLVKKFPDTKEAEIAAKKLNGMKK